MSLLLSTLMFTSPRLLSTLTLFPPWMFVLLPPVVDFFGMFRSVDFTLPPLMDCLGRLTCRAAEALPEVFLLREAVFLDLEALFWLTAALLLDGRLI
jgi:hypothetical protein